MRPDTCQVPPDPEQGCGPTGSCLVPISSEQGFSMEDVPRWGRPGGPEDMRNLFTKSALVAALVTLVPVAALASQARVQSLGLQGDFIQDYTNIYAYPSSIVRYQNLVYGDLGTKNVDGGDLSEFEDNGDIVPGLQNS